MKNATIAMLAVLSAVTQAQSDAGEDAMTIEDINSLFDNMEEGTVIAPSPFPMEDGEAGEDWSKEDMDGEWQDNANEELTETLDWIKDVHKALCEDLREFAQEMMGDADEDTEDEPMPFSQEELDEMLMAGVDPEDLAKSLAEAQSVSVEDKLKMAEDSASSWSGEDELWLSDDDSEAMQKLTRAHRVFCSTLKGIYDEGTAWNNADTEEKQEIQERVGGQIMDFVNEFFDGATTYAVAAGTTIAAVALAF